MKTETTTRTVTRAELAVMYPPPAPATADELAALRRLIDIAKSDTGQSRRVADFLLAWWNAGSCGGFDLTTLWGVDSAIADDMHAVFGLIARVSKYPNQIDESFDAEFRAIVREWRPELADAEEK
jgi:hypothetical protein